MILNIEVLVFKKYSELIYFFLENVSKNQAVGTTCKKGVAAGSGPASPSSRKLLRCHTVC
jgi:hypothetical protein